MEGPYLPLYLLLCFLMGFVVATIMPEDVPTGWRWTIYLAAALAMGLVSFIL